MPLGVDLSTVDLSTAIAKVAKDTIPAVAHIEVTQRQEFNNPFPPFERIRSFTISSTFPITWPANSNEN